MVTNRDLPGDELVRWYRRRCGKGEEVHAVLKEDLAGGRMPSGEFGANAAWWAIVVLAFNLHSAMKWLVLGWRVGEQTPEGGALRGHPYCRTSGHICQETDHPPGERAPFL